MPRKPKVQSATENTEAVVSEKTVTVAKTILPRASHDLAIARIQGFEKPIGIVLVPKKKVSVKTKEITFQTVKKRRFG